MKREQRVRRINAMAEFLKEANDELDVDSIPLVPAEGQFNNAKEYRTDVTMDFGPDDLNQAIEMASNKEWITMPSHARRKGIPTLYELDPATATDHEKYFGIKTPYGFVHTPATAALFHAAAFGRVPRKDLSKVKRLVPPAEYDTKFSGAYLLTLDPGTEEAVVRAAYNLMQEAHEKPELLRRFHFDSDEGRADTTTSHSRGVREISTGVPLSPEMERRKRLLELGLNKGIEEYPRLNSMVETFVKGLDARIETLLKEQYNVNRTVRFEGSRADTDDILKQNILRLILEKLGSEDSPLQGTMFEEEDYRLM